MIGITFGAFDLLHAGHAAFLCECADRCEHLIVGLHTDPSIERKWKNKPIQTVFERHVQLIAVEKVQLIIPYDTEKDLLNMLAIYKPDRYFLGSDYRDKKLPDEVMHLCDKIPIEICYIDRYHNYSSTELRQRVSNFNEKSKGKCDKTSGLRKS